MARFTGKSVLITGGSSGIGLTVARAFRDEGAIVVITGRDEQPLENARAMLGEREEVDEAMWDESFDINVKGAYFTIQALVPGHSGLCNQPGSRE